MSIDAKTTTQINALIISQLQANLNQSFPLLPKAFIRVLAKTLSGVYVLLYKYAGFTLLQMFVRTASDQDTIVNGELINPLKFWGRLIGVGDPTGATQAELLVAVTVTQQGGVLRSGSPLLGASNGVTYITLGGVPLNAPTVNVVIRAVSDQVDGGGAGVIGNLDPADEVTFAQPLGNVERVALVVSQEVTGADPEDTEVYRQRVIDRFQKRPQGGAYADYEQWGEETPGIINVYPYTGQPGQVDVYSEATPESSGNVDGIPTEAQLEAVLNMINLDQNGLASRRNANAFVNSYPIARTGFDVTVSGIAGVSDLGQVQTDITAALDEYFASLEPFIAGLSIPPRRDQITRTRVSAIVEDVVTAAGGTFTAAVFYLTGGTGSLGGYVLDEGEKTKLVNVVYL